MPFGRPNADPAWRVGTPRSVGEGLRCRSGCPPAGGDEVVPIGGACAMTRADSLRPPARPARPLPLDRSHCPSRSRRRGRWCPGYRGRSCPRPCHRLHDPCLEGLDPRQRALDHPSGHRRDLGQPDRRSLHPRARHAGRRRPRRARPRAGGPVRPPPPARGCLQPQPSPAPRASRSRCRWPAPEVRPEPSVREPP